MRDIMLDLETLSAGSNAVIVSISAVEFTLETGGIGQEYHTGIHVLDQALDGGEISSDTLKWWKEQSKEAKARLCDTESYPPYSVLEDLNTWILKLGHPVKDVRLWGNGAGFDNVILRNLYARSKVNFVLPFRCDTDVRTLVSFADEVRSIPFTGIKHYGIDDCKHQIKMCHAAYKLFKGQQDENS